MARKSQKARVVQSRKKKNRAEKRSRHLNRNTATNLSPAKTLSVSIMESFVPLNLSDDGPISRLPNELVQSILVRLEMQQLIPMQVVCKKWQAVIDSIGHKQKSLFLTDFCTINVDCLKEQSFGEIDLNTFTYIKVKPNLKSSEHFRSQFGKLFPAVEQLVFNLTDSFEDVPIVLEIMPLNQLTTLSVINPIYDSDQVATLLACINSCTSLKRLDIFAQYKLLPTLVPTFSRLEQFSCYRFNVENDEDEDDDDLEDDWLSFVRHFGPNCSRVFIQNYYINDSAQWHTINSQWMASVTHLDLDYVELDEVILNLSEHAPSLQVLRLNCFLMLGNNPSLNTQMIGHLRKLTRLTEIGLNSINLDLSQLEETARNYQLVSLFSIQTCALKIGGFTSEPDSNRVTSVLSTIFPNVKHLNIFSFEKLKGVEQYLNRFAKLHTHSFDDFEYAFDLSGI